MFGAKKMKKLSRGFDIKLLGRAENVTLNCDWPSLYAVKPPDVVGIAPIPKLSVDIESRVRAGDSLFFDKQRPQIHFCSPVSGEVIRIGRGPKRAITEVVVMAEVHKNSLKCCCVTSYRILNMAWLRNRLRYFLFLSAYPGYIV